MVCKVWVGVGVSDLQRGRIVGDVTVAAMSDISVGYAENTGKLAQALTSSFVCRVCCMEGREDWWTISRDDIV